MTAYVHLPGAAVPKGYANIEKFPGKTIEECEDICHSMPDCVAFEYGVYDGGSSGSNLNGIYNIRIGGGTNDGEEFLFSSTTGSVQLWHEDDDAGRQKWKLTQIGGDQSNLYNVEIFGGTIEGE